MTNVEPAATVTSTRNAIPLCRFSSTFSHHEAIEPESMKGIYEPYMSYGVQRWNTKRHPRPVPFQLNQFYAGASGLKEVEACLDRMFLANTDLLTDSVEIKLAHPELGSNDVKLTKVSNDELPDMMMTTLHVIGRREPLPSLIRQLRDAFPPFRAEDFCKAAFLQAWQASRAGNRVKGHPIYMEIRGWLLTDMDAMVFLDKAMFEETCKALKVATS